MNRTFHVLKTPVYRFDLYGRYRRSSVKIEAVHEMMLKIQEYPWNIEYGVRYLIMITQFFVPELHDIAATTLKFQQVGATFQNLKKCNYCMRYFLVVCYLILVIRIGYLERVI